MRERAREGEREGDGECDGEEEEEKSASQIRRKESRFTVESKAFEIVVEERSKDALWKRREGPCHGYDWDRID